MINKLTLWWPQNLKHHDAYNYVHTYQPKANVPNKFVRALELRVILTINYIWKYIYYDM